MKLLIGYGNELRGDDGLGPRIARHIDSARLPGVSVLVGHQLTPEMTGAIARADVVLFVAAARRSKEVRMEKIEVRRHARETHALDPASLLGLSELVHGTSPPGWLLAVPGTRFDNAAGLSEQARNAFEEALMWARTWLLADGEEELSGTIPSWVEVGAGD